MELHPILDAQTAPNPKLWYVLSTLGDSPSMRVGHTCTYVKDPSSKSSGKVYVIGGANPSGSFNDVYVLDLDTLQWDTIEAPGFKARYEHVAFVTDSQPTKIFVFGGADQNGNQNDVQVLDLNKKKWSTLSTEGLPPSPRTHHTTAVVGNLLVVYSGGHTGAEAVCDRKVHILDTSTAKWYAPSITGEPPKPRSGHVMLVIGKKVYVHGGMASSTFYGDLHYLDLERECWTMIKKKKHSPSARAGHGGVVHGNQLYIFGGMNKDGALDDMHKYDPLNDTWSEVKLDGPPPANRLDYGMCVIQLQRTLTNNNDDNIQDITQSTKDLLNNQLDTKTTTNLAIPQEGSQEKEQSGLEESLQACHISAKPSSKGECHGAEVTYQLCLINGGMDTVGEIFDDTLVMLLP